MENEIITFENLLVNIGLTKSESKIYLALLSLGKAGTSQILEKAKINSGKIYDTLNSLKNKGFISEITENNKKKFMPSDTKKVQEYLDNKNKQIINCQTTFDSLLPKILSQIKPQKQKIKIEVYTGYEGYKIVSQKEISYYKKNETLYVLGVLPPEKYTKEVDSYFMENIQPKRLMSKIKIKKIFSEEAKKYKQYMERNAEVKYLPYNSPVTLNIISNLSIIEIFSEELIMISIESEEVAKSFKEQFNAMWRNAN
ncbi:MAG: helix-turn-helix domain-containing protein [archaeon]